MDDNGCLTGKKRYENNLMALQELKRLQEKVRETTAVRTYLCWHCKGYHLTSSPLRPPRGEKGSYAYNMIASY